METHATTTEGILPAQHEQHHWLQALAHESPPATAQFPAFSEVHTVLLSV